MARAKPGRAVVRQLTTLMTCQRGLRLQIIRVARVDFATEMPRFSGINRQLFT